MALIKKAGGLLDYLIDEFDDRFANQVGSSSIRKGEVKGTAGTKVTVEDAPQLEIPLIDFRDYEGRGLITSMADRTQGGGMLTRIDGQPLTRPVQLEGGQNFMVINPDLWGSFPSVVDDHLELARYLKGITGGKDPLFAPWMMTPKGMDYSTMPVHSMLGFIDGTASKRLKNAITQQVRQTVPNFVGFNKDWEKQIFAMSGDERKALQKALDALRGDTGIGSGKARVSVADPDQLSTPDGILFNVGEFSGNLKSAGPQRHGTYKGSMEGDFIGRSSQPVKVTEAIPETITKTGVVRKVKDPSNPTSDDLRSMMMGPKGAVIDEKMLRRMYGGLGTLGAGSILGALAGGSNRAVASPVPGGYDMPSMSKVREGLSSQQSSSDQEATNMILETILNFMAPTSIGGGIDTMTGYQRSQTR